MIRRPRGAILLEVLLAIGLFVGAAAFCLGVTKSLFSALDRADRRRLAIDLARSKLAELDAGLISVQDLRGEWSGGVGSRQDDVELEVAASGPSWEIDTVTTRTEYVGAFSASRSSYYLNWGITCSVSSRMELTTRS